MIGVSTVTFATFRFTSVFQLKILHHLSIISEKSSCKPFQISPKALMITHQAERIILDSTSGIKQQSKTITSVITVVRTNPHSGKTLLNYFRKARSQQRTPEEHNKGKHIGLNHILISTQATKPYNIKSAILALTKHTLPGYLEPRGI